MNASKSRFNQKNFLIYLMLSFLAGIVLILSMLFITGELPEPWHNFGMQGWGLFFIIWGIAARINVLPEWMLKEEPKNFLVIYMERFQPWSSLILTGFGVVMVLYYWIWR